MNAFGASQEVRVSFALPGSDVEFPIEVSGDPSALTYEWVAGARLDRHRRRRGR